MTRVALLITDGCLAKLGGHSRSLTGILMAFTCAAAVAAYGELSLFPQAGYCRSSGCFIPKPDPYRVADTDHHGDVTIS